MGRNRGVEALLTVGRLHKSSVGEHAERIAAEQALKDLEDHLAARFVVRDFVGKRFAGGAGLDSTVVLQHLAAGIFAHDVMFLVFGDPTQPRDAIDMPEICFLRDMVGPAQKSIRDGFKRELIQIPKDVRWSGTQASGLYRSSFLDSVVPCIAGRLDLVFVWANDPLSGVTICDGRYEEREVVLSLGEKKR